MPLPSVGPDGVNHHVGAVPAETRGENATGVGHKAPRRCVYRRTRRRREVDSSMKVAASAVPQIGKRAGTGEGQHWAMGPRLETSGKAGKSPPFQTALGFV